ncbi:hypothetical protein [Deinococcus maricopensis]|uniref:DUF4064 domain-containing protein n=1 Tax=Deinococcus maricopensis (strain DSM 21211 / LMG 22137 / NRRL B-23946 / LB-34) TaxID=709986 RepID=E8UBY3_DEIML|nr:hypothetical protein [Deinococcus maricopensis]ADV68572.1 hypothetical protein Deima_2943 [Deinococcus maricopensis DSM 21211]
MVPQKLSWVTTSLIITMVLGVLGLLLLPFLGGFLNMVLGASSENAQELQIARLFTGASLWVSGLVGIAWLVFEFFTFKALQAGKSWGRIAAIVIGIISLLNFPIGTILGIFMLIGAFDPDVQRYASR